MKTIKLNQDSIQIINQLVEMNNETEDKRSNGTFFKDTSEDEIANLLIKKGYNTYHESQIKLTSKEARILLDWHEASELNFKHDQEDNELSTKIRAALNNGQIF